MSLGKLLVLAAIIALVWFGFRWIDRLKREKSERRRVDRERARAQVVDLEHNPKTGAYEPRQRDD